MYAEMYNIYIVYCGTIPGVAKVSFALFGRGSHDRVDDMWFDQILVCLRAVCQAHECIQNYTQYFVV